MKPHAFKTWKYFKLYCKKDKIRDGNRYQRAMKKTICDIDTFYEAVSANGEMTNDWLLERYAYIQSADKTSANVEEACLVGALSGLISGIILWIGEDTGNFFLNSGRDILGKPEALLITLIGIVVLAIMIVCFWDIAAWRTKNWLNRINKNRLIYEQIVCGYELDKVRSILIRRQVLSGCYLGVICVLSERDGQSGDRLLNI